MAKQSRIERAGREGIVVDAEPVDEAFRIPSLWLLDDVRLNARRVIAHGGKNDPRIRIGRQSANLSDGRATTEDDGADFAIGGRREDSYLDGAAVVLEDALQLLALQAALSPLRRDEPFLVYVVTMQNGFDRALACHEAEWLIEAGHGNDVALPLHMIELSVRLDVFLVLL